MDRDSWEKKYKPLKNVENAAFDGLMYETYGKELDSLTRKAKAFAKNDGATKNGYHVWTIVDGEGSKVIILNGWHVVNRLGYMITKNAWLEGQEIEVE